MAKNIALQILKRSTLEDLQAYLENMSENEDLQNFYNEAQAIPEKQKYKEQLKFLETYMIERGLINAEEQEQSEENQDTSTESQNEEHIITYDERMFFAIKEKFDRNEMPDLSADDIYSVKTFINRKHDDLPKESDTFVNHINKLGAQCIADLNDELVQWGVSNDVDDIQRLLNYIRAFRDNASKQDVDKLYKNIEEKIPQNEPSLIAKSIYSSLWDGSSNLTKIATLDEEDLDLMKEIINYAKLQQASFDSSNNTPKEIQELKDDAQEIIDALNARIEELQPQAEQTVTDNTPTTQAEDVKEEPTQETPTLGRKSRTPQELLDIAMGANRLQSIEDAMTTDEIIALHEHIGKLRPKRNAKLSKEETNALRIRNAIDEIVLHTLGTRLVTPPYQELKDIEKSGKQFLLRDIFRHYQQEDKNNEKQAEAALKTLNIERRKRGFEDLEYRFEYLNLPKNKRPDYQQFLFDKFYETLDNDILESMGINNIYAFKKNIDTYLASHGANDTRKTLITLQINQAINSYREAQKQEKKRHQQEANLPIIKAIYDEIKDYAIAGNITEINNVLQRLQPNQLGLIEQMEQYAAEQAKNEQDEKIKAKLEDISAYIVIRIVELREEQSKAKEQEQETNQTTEPTSEPVVQEPENRADIYDTIDKDNILDFVKEEPETIKKVLQGCKSEDLTILYKMIEYNIDKGHIATNDVNLKKFYNVAINHILEDIKTDTRTTDDYSSAEIKQRAELLQIYAQDFDGNHIEFENPDDTQFYSFQLDMFTQSAEDIENATKTQINNNDDENSGTQQTEGLEDILTSIDEDTYWMLEQTARDAYDDYVKFYETGTLDQPNNRMARLNRFFENVDIEHDEEWRNIGDKLRQLSSQNIYQKYDSYTAEDLKHEFLELARQNAIKEILDENKYDEQGNFLDELGRPIFISDLQDKIQEKILDHMEESVITLMLSQAQKDNNDRLLAGLEKDENGQLTKQGLENFRKRVLEEITEVGDRDTSRNSTEKIKDFVTFWQTKDETKHKFIISDSVAFSVIKERYSQVHQDIKNLWARFTSETKVGAFAAKLYERNKKFNEKLAKEHPALNTLYQYGKGVGTSLAVGFIAAKTAPIVMTVYCATMSVKAVNSVYKGYKEYKKQNKESNFWGYFKNNKAQVIGTALVAAGTAVGITADALSGANLEQIDWANVSKGSRLGGAIMMGANEALKEIKKGNYGVAFTRFMTTATTVFLATNNTNASNEDVNTAESEQPKINNTPNETIKEDTEIKNHTETNENTDSLSQKQQSPQTTVSEDVKEENSHQVENQTENNANTEQHRGNSEHHSAPAKPAEQTEVEREDKTLAERNDTNNNNQQHSAQYKSDETTIINDEISEQDAEIADIEKSTNSEISEVEKEDDTLTEISASSATNIDDSANTSEEEAVNQETIIPTEDKLVEDLSKDENYESSLEEDIQKVEEEAERSAFEAREIAKEIEASQDENMSTSDFSEPVDNGLTGESLYTYVSRDAEISVYENGFSGVENKDGEVTQTWNILVDADGRPFGSIHTATGEKIMTPQQLDYYNRLSADCLMHDDNPARDQVLKLYGDINNAVDQSDNTTPITSNTETNNNTDTTDENSGNNDRVDLTELNIMAATERADEFGLTGGDTRIIESGQYQGTVVTKAENGWQIRYPEGNSVILKAENGNLNGMFIDSDNNVKNMNTQEVEQYRQAATDAYKNSQTTYSQTSANAAAHSGRMGGRSSGYI